MLITHTYFTRGPLTVPNTSQPEVKSLLDDYIDLYEEDLLRKALGETMRAALIAGLAANTPAARWTTLKLGTAFTDATGRQLKFEGLAPDNVLRMGAIAPYVYFYMVRDRVVQFSGAGFTAAAYENSATVSPMQRMANAFNVTVEQVQLLWSYLKENQATYPEWKESEVQKEVFTKINGFGI